MHKSPSLNSFEGENRNIAFHSDGATPELIKVKRNPQLKPSLHEGSEQEGVYVGPKRIHSEK